VNLLQQGVARHTDDQTVAVRLRKARRQAVFYASFALVLAGVVTTLIVIDRNEARDAKLLEDQAGRPPRECSVTSRHPTA
jgi:hypothetical protein